MKSDDKTGCGTSKDCQPGWMCNFDYGVKGGFCENCANFPTTDDCHKTGFITTTGTNECIQHCSSNNGKITLLVTRIEELYVQYLEVKSKVMTTIPTTIPTTTTEITKGT